MKIAIIGDMLDDQEFLYKRPLIGSAGQELDRLLAEAGLSRADCFVTTVFKCKPRGNDATGFCVSGNDPLRVRGRPALASGKYLSQEYEAELTRLRAELEQVRPNLAILLGPVASWAILGQPAVSKIRGACTVGAEIPWLKCLPVYHPGTVLRQYDLRHVTVLDFIKAKAEADFPELRRPVREVWVEPTLEDLELFWREHGESCREFSFDIETAFGQITCIGFATDVGTALVVPFLDYRKPGGHYWPTLEEELEAWSWVAKFCAHPQAKSVGQNTLYDIQYLWYLYGIPVPSYQDDTMLLHHSLHPESEKGLAFLGSVYTNEVAWKPLRPRGKNMVKREDE
jgi:uracil-DNA glycosylase